jgi:SAM-dependent methyltransferase
MYDVVLCQQGLQFVPDRLKALGEMRRVLASGGRVAVSVWTGPSPCFVAMREGLARYVSPDAGQIRRRRAIGKADYQAKGVLYVPEEARYSRLLTLPEGQNIGRAINDAMREIETENETLKEFCRRSTTASTTTHCLLF